MNSCYISWLLQGGNQPTTLLGDLLHTEKVKNQKLVGIVSLESFYIVKDFIFTQNKKILFLQITKTS